MSALVVNRQGCVENVIQTSLSRKRAVDLVYPHFGWLRELPIALKLGIQFMDVAKAIES